uniref:Uncharacterized protein n=1 Tax=Anguilla anguilla TaxID=7936 RepID=A0A0E9TZ22_ANGAN
MDTLVIYFSIHPCSLHIIRNRISSGLTKWFFCMSKHQREVLTFSLDYESKEI